VKIMPDIYVIGDTIRFTAGIVNMDGNAYDPEEVKLSVISPDGTVLLDEVSAEKVTTGSYRYDWQISGVTDASKLIVIWNWSNNKKRMKFRVVPETDW
jgi:hypothetical protein